ncbi:MAG TPA: hypothetical protein VIM42_06845 [Clostridium sp.]
MIIAPSSDTLLGFYALVFYFVIKIRSRQAEYIAVLRIKNNGKGIGRPVTINLDDTFKTVVESHKYKLLEIFEFKEWGCLPGIADFDGEICSHLYYGLKI